ncbi:GNAT family N-acetyltransferase [Streptomyces sp. HNM1019]|uniref:GNAT family N-acetyltransferase n=1 Tax=Streptomyces sp. HNM1019 TaxID=3424717 RepID=UPI003D786652
MVRLRVVTMDDWPLWRDVRRAALAEAPHAFKSRLADWHHGGEERWRARLAMPDAYHVVALLDGRAVGMAGGIPGSGDGDPGSGDGGGDGDGRPPELRSVWVSPEARGHGVGGLLIAAVETWALRTGATALRLAVIPDNASAIALYERHGFAATREPGDLLADGVTRELVMVKALRRS